MTMPAVPSYAGYRVPAEFISHIVWLRSRAGITDSGCDFSDRGFRLGRALATLLG